MEPLDLIAAKLVLGYLRSAKCKTAHKEFFKTSSNLKHLDYKKSKYMPTRFLGQTLEEVLMEYFKISQIIQGRLEVTNFYNENHSKTSLQEQLLYLLNYKVSPSRSSTPLESTQCVSSNYASPNHSDIEATPVHTLPGNTESEASFSLNPSSKRKSNSVSERNTPSPSRISPIENAEIFDTEVLAQNLMENKEFQEKIAHTINKVVERQYKERHPEELNKTVKCAVEETQADPIFEELLRDIMGSSNILETNKNSELENSTSSNKEKKKNTIDTSLSKNKSDQPQVVTQINNEHNMSHNNTLDSFIISNNCSLVSRSTCVQNPVFINTVTGLLIPSVTTTVSPSNPLIVLNKSNPVATPAALTEQDIIKMPIIINESNEVIPVVESGKPKKGSKKPKMLLPHPTINLAPEAPSDLKSYFKNYAPPENPTVIEDSTEVTTSKSKVGLKRVLYPKTSKKSPRIKKNSVSSSQTKKDEPDTTVTNNIPPKEYQNKEVSSSTEKNATPVPAPSDNVKKPTPKSGSHVRNLNFSTPPKSQMKPEDSKCITAQKNQAVKTLFSKAWDADLRAALPKEENQDIIPKKQQTNGSKKTRKKNKTAISNATEKEGILLEAAIKTPVKHSDTAINVENKSDVEGFESKPIQSQVKTVLSPSKLHNTSKNILETKNNEGNTSVKFVTPDMSKESVVQPVTANRNIMPMLETPIKIQLPKTPGISTPFGINMSNVSTTTPFTKMLEANLDLKGIDIDSIQTPKLPITPNFTPFTPTIDLISPYSNRPTDYSTGSSYYQPSDNEQNKNLEAHLREIEKTCTGPEIPVNDRLQIFNKNVIGKKNLNIVKTNMEINHSFDTSSNEEDTSMEEDNKESNDTVIFKKKNDMPKRTYPLRNRAKSIEKSFSPKILIKTTKTSAKVANISKKEKKNTVKSETENIVSTTINVNEIANILHENNPTESDKATVRGVTASQQSVLNDLESKRQRVVNSLKPQTDTHKLKKQPNIKFKIKPIAKVYTTKKNKRSDSPKKKKRNRDIDIVLKDLITSDDSDINISQSFSDEEDKVKKDKLLNIDKSDKTASDVEAQNLIEGLKERGIHLMQNKSSKKKLLNNGEYLIDTSGTQLEMFDRDSFDMINFNECISITYNETDIPIKKVKTALQDSKKIEYIGQLYLDSIGDQIEIHLKQTDFITIIDIDPSKGVATEKNMNDNPLTLNESETIDTSIDIVKKTRYRDDKREVGVNAEKETIVHEKKQELKISEMESINTKHNESTQCNDKDVNMKLNEIQSTNCKKVKKIVSESNSKTSKRKSKEKELIETIKEKPLLIDAKHDKLSKTQHKDEKRKKETHSSEPKLFAVDNIKSKQCTDNKKEKKASKNTITKPDNKSSSIKSQDKNSDKGKRLSDDGKVSNKQNLIESKEMSDNKVTPDSKKINKKTKEKRIGSKKDKQVPGTKPQPSNERSTENEVIQNEKNKQDRLSTESKNLKSVFRSNSNDKDLQQADVDKDVEDDLMNFASTGKDQKDVSCTSVSKKRRLSDEILAEHSCKKMLKTLDVDSFLNKIHAGTSIGGKK